MSRIIPFGAIPNTNIFPDGIFRLRVEKLEDVLTKEREGKTQKLMYHLSATVVEPAQFKGLFYDEYFVIGTDDDPEADDLATWKRATRFKKFTTALGIPTSDEEDSEMFCSLAKGCEFLATIVQKTEPDKKKDANGVEYDNPYKGQVRNNTSAFWKLGEKDPGLVNGSADKPATRARTARPATTAQPETKVAPSDDVSCSACKKRVPRKELRDHVNKHLQEDLSRASEPRVEDEE